MPVVDPRTRTAPHGDPLFDEVYPALTIKRYIRLCYGVPEDLTMGTSSRKVAEMFDPAFAFDIDPHDSFWSVSWDDQPPPDIAADLRAFASSLKLHPLASSYQREMADRMMDSIAETLGVDLSE